MATAKASDLVTFVINAKNNGWGYVYSAQGQLYTRQLAEEWAKARRSGRDYNYFVERCSRWFGRTVVDCSGLIIEAFRNQIPGYGDKSANTLFSKCVKTGMLNTIPEMPGLCVWRSGHIGMYIGKGKVVEAGGTNVGVVISDLTSPATAKRWTNWGKLADVDYEESTTPPVGDTPAFWLGRYLKLTQPNMQGDDVADVQQALARQGFSPGTIDGKYGQKTDAAVKNAQKSKGLSADGVVGPDTTKALNGVWMTDSNGQNSPNTDNPLGTFAVKRLIKLTSPYMRGDDVRDVQEALQIVSFSPGESDGVFGPRSENAVKAFQKSRGLKADGIVGENTVKALGGLWTGN